MMYYFVPKQAERPIYSYRLSIIHFWSLIFLYIWAGPHHLHYTALPDWAQTLGMVFSIMLWMPSWGGMINGLMTLNGAWDKIRTDPIIRMMVIALAFYGMATFEGPMMSIKAVNSLSPLYRLDDRPRPCRRARLERHDHLRRALLSGAAPVGPRRGSIRCAWSTGTSGSRRSGIVLYASAMWVAGIMQGLMWREYGADGYLVYAFAEVVAAMHPMYLIRAAGGLLYLAGVLIMVWNVVDDDRRPAARRGADDRRRLRSRRATARCPRHARRSSARRRRIGTEHGRPHLRSTRRSSATSPCSRVLAFVVVAIGGIVEIAPLFWIDSTIEKVEGVRPYTPLELAGRNIYVREGCYSCHSQMIRPFRDEVERYGHYSLAAESMYDHPFQWGSKRTGPDLARVGGRYSDEWHVQHLQRPARGRAGIDHAALRLPRRARPRPRATCARICSALSAGRRAL